MTSGNDIFTHYNKCFFCDSDDLGDVQNYEYHDTPYTYEIRKKNNLTIKDINSNLILKKCNHCHSLTFTKWFSHSISETLYNLGKHRMGWNRFLNTIYKNNPESIQRDIDKFLKLSLEINKIDSYLELRCPFMGMYPLFSLVNEPKVKNEKLFNSKIERLRIFFYKLIKKKKLNKNFYENIAKIQLPYKNIFLSDSSKRGWGTHCNSFGCNCKNIIEKFDWIETFKLENLSLIDKDIDLLYLSNTIDHIDKPLKTLSALSHRVKNIYIEFHSINGGAQHCFFLQKETMELIATKLGFGLRYLSGKNEFLLVK